MSSIYKEVFTDAAKDVIGNDPVLDQFDISYAASLYGSMADAYMAGPLLSINKNTQGFSTFTTGSRGSAFSKFYQTGFPEIILDENYLIKSPRFSWYLKPWKERFSRTARFIQCFDSNERYYDSCLPDLNNALKVDGSEVWGIDPNSSNFHSVLSPTSDYVTASAGYIIFNSIKQDRSSEGFETDPLVNNMWTWSYPYENKYVPTRRYLKFTDTLGIDGTYLYCDWSINVNSYDLGLKFNNLRKYRPENYYKFNAVYPILPGKFREDVNESRGGSGYRNAMRGVFNNSKSYKVSLPNLFDGSLDSVSGISFLLPTDSNLLKRADVSNLDSTKKTQYGITNTSEPLLEPLNLDDSVRFFFGFGDLNNMTYASASIVEKDSNLYSQDFEREAIGTYYFLSGSGTGLFVGFQEPFSTSDDRGLSVGPQQPLPNPNPATILTKTISGSISGPFIQFVPDGSTSSFWQTKKGFPGNITYTFQNNEDLLLTLNMQTTFTNAKVRAVGYLTGSSGITIAGYADSSDYVPSTWGQVKITYPGSHFSGSVVDSETRLVFDIQFTDTNEDGTISLKTWHDYGGEISYSRLETSISVDPNDLFLITPNRIETFSDSNVVIDWSNSRVGDYENWSIKYKDGNQVLSGNNFSYVGVGSSPPQGIYWENSINESNYVLYVDSYTSEEFPPVSIDITSSLPWSVKYYRGSLVTDMNVYFSGIPGTPSTDDTTSLYSLETYPASTENYDIMSLFNSININGGTTTNPTVFGPGEYRLCFSVGNGAKSSINDLQITTHNIEFDPFGPKIGGNNYPQFRYYAVNDLENCDVSYNSYTSSQRLATKQFYQSHISSFSPVIRGWKYGLINGFPVNTKTVFRRDRYGQFRDMLEQRQYTKLVTVNDSPTDDDAIVKDNFNPLVSSRLSRTITMSQVNDSPVQVGFFKQRYKKDERGIGYIYKERVSPDQTFSQNLSVEATSSLPYFDGMARERQESQLKFVTDASLTTFTLDSTGFTVI